MVPGVGGGKARLREQENLGPWHGHPLGGGRLGGDPGSSPEPRSQRVPKGRAPGRPAGLLGEVLVKVQTSSSGPKLGEQAGLGADVGGEEGRQGGAAPSEAESPGTDPSGAQGTKLPRARLTPQAPSPGARPAASATRQTGSWLTPLLPTRPPPRNFPGPGSPSAFNQGTHTRTEACHQLLQHRPALYPHPYPFQALVGNAHLSQR